MRTASFNPRSLLSVLAAGLMAVSAWADPVRYIGHSPPLSGPGIPPMLDSFFDVFVDVDLPPLGGSGGIFSGTGGGLFHTPSLDFPLNSMIQLQVGPNSGGSVPIEILSLNLTGGPFPIRESPTLPSLGMGTVGPGGQHISSFFDVFIELSLDGGVSWNPVTSAPMHMTSVVPETGSVAGMMVLALGLLGVLRRKTMA